MPTYEITLTPSGVGVVKTETQYVQTDDASFASARFALAYEQWLKREIAVQVSGVSYREGDTRYHSCEHVTASMREVDPHEPVAMTRGQAIAWLAGDAPQAATPGSRYGRTALDCAPTAYALALCVATEQGDGLTLDALDYAMGLVVNDHDDVSEVLRSCAYNLTGDDADHVRNLVSEMSEDE